MANEKQYLEVFNDGTNDLYVMDAEAQAAIAEINISVPNTYATKADTYTKTEVDNMVLANLFRLYVDPADMHLKGRSPSNGTFEVVNGHLILHQN